ncbi:hypothetical protein [Tenacibaculum maritimum]|uniref:hypothetical protein n=1 Tax=Tenacibaculum maritimum TaxID=107401 RepID=UPI0013301709|nr:hypothetical protein [Tenacibaculum maritimum]
MTELNKKQSEKADYLLEIVCNSQSAIDSKVAYDLSDSNVGFPFFELIINPNI